MNLLNQAYQWLLQQEALWFWLGISSVLMFIISIATLPWMASQIPQDYFLPTARQHRKKQHIGKVILLIIIKNTIGLVLLVLGFIMLFLPGQGLLTILVAIILLDFPGKYALEQWLISRPGILKAINWLRFKRGRKPLLTPKNL